MSHSNIVKDLLHKLSKNEFLAQDGGYQTYSNKAKQYRNQLKSLYGAGKEDDNKLFVQINENLDKLVPISLLEKYAAEAQKIVDVLLREKDELRKNIEELQKAAASGDLNAQEGIRRLQQELEAVQAKMAQLQAELSNKVQELANSADDLSNLRTQLGDVNTRTAEVSSATNTSQPISELLARLQLRTSLPPVSASSTSLTP